MAVPYLPPPWLTCGERDPLAEHVDDVLRHAGALLPVELLELGGDGVEPGDLAVVDLLLQCQRVQIALDPIAHFACLGLLLEIGKRRVGKECSSRWSPE